MTMVNLNEGTVWKFCNGNFLNIMKIKFFEIYWLKNVFKKIRSFNLFVKQKNNKNSNVKNFK
jgi:hypothetical protein